MNHVRQAVILAAGMGSRLKGVIEEKPKGFLQLGNKPIIEESIAKLIGFGITKIVIVTGYSSEYYERLKKKYPFVRTIKNQRFENTGSMFSLSIVKDLIDSNFLLLESDLIYEHNALQVLNNSKFNDCILLSGRTSSGDEVYAGIKENRIVNLSKNLGEIKTLGGELVGISKISYDLYQAMINHAEKQFRKNQQYQYEDCLTDVSKMKEINYEFVEDLAWIEIDDKNHFKRAVEKIYPLVQKRDAEFIISKKISRNVLLNPGPATTTDTVKHAMVVEDICPREKEFGELVESIRKDLVRIVNGKDLFEAVLFASSGTGAIEACLTSVVPDNKSVLIINNGAYGERMQQICKNFEVNRIDYNIEWGDPVDLRTIESILSKHKGKISHLAFVHHETTVGILNSLELISKLALKYNIEIIVDAMSSFAGIPIDVNESNIHYLISSANKCIQGMAGISFVICNIDSLKKTKDYRRRSFYFNLYDNYTFFSEHNQMQFTPPVQVLYALRQAISEYFIETEEGRTNRYTELYEVLKNGLEKLGFKFLVDDRFHAKILTSIIEPDDDNYNFTEMHDYLYKRGFTIYPGKGAKQNTFRLANMGEIYKEDIVRFLNCLETYKKLKAIKL
ncbi:MAG: 2-aminoethylphosphonate--pyruvate transaminase [Ignavibacteria bacterium]|nr:2-aminoethylphosphonate--pyruvate transaminase [Ignavibacteria bacterium]MBT8381483.1 2-aminoethylphosphonate--pyruvate transaminase [Ignavibacteria bacterium]MBT8391545.1 2-aminoethylphosphonate--pyruvate transaminase [Ignavibacteria bacterium]NNJ52237.1 2-aminoethylphosphonate--pyruvate transaminase [Ignavibacteriaceae bacterium]NNL22714.1 2-aminoethylphosphonate--pyruvate transaminase [Ignavibacteriaceae bacterium]